jgi:DNA-binding NtrC family response regulator
MKSKVEILIIDDQLSPRESIRMILKEKYAISTVTGAIEAFKYMAENLVELVLLDIKMPKIDGITALKEIKKKHPETEVILLTAYATPKTIQNTLKLGAFGYLMKPFDKDDLLDIVDRALKNQPSRKPH